MSDGYFHERTEAKHKKKCEAKHVKKCEAKHESTSEVEYENKTEAEHQRTHHDMSFYHTQHASSQFSFVESKTHPNDPHDYKICK
jgi:hypothetical protein